MIMENKNKFFVTTPIYYPNSNLHIGHAYSTLIADILKRYKKLQGYETFFLTGSDEHGQKIEDTAKSKNIDPKNFVDEIIINFKILWKLLDIDYDHFIRTTDKEHINYVQNNFSILEKKGHIYKGEYEGLYCKFDETFYPQNQVKNNECPECKRKLISLKEESYFLKVNNYKEWIKNELLTTDLLWPKYRTNELINNFVNNLQDLSITRKSITWGIKVKNDNSHIIYVWLDALQNYLSTFTYKNKPWKIEEVWGKNSKTEIIQIVGKEITRFHGIYWPIILNMLDYKNPKILAHGWIVSESGDKMSKSLNNVIDPIKVIKKYGSDVVRFFLIYSIQIGEDGKFSEDNLVNVFNGILVNKYSNLVNRTISMIQKYCEGVVPSQGTNIIKIDKNLDFQLKNLIEKYHENFSNNNLTQALKIAIIYIEELNKFIDTQKPWNINDEKVLATILNYLIKNIWNSAILLSPFLVKATLEIEVIFDKKITSFKDLNFDFKNLNLNSRSNSFLFTKYKK